MLVRRIRRNMLVRLTAPVQNHLCYFIFAIVYAHWVLSTLLIFILSIISLFPLSTG